MQNRILYGFGGVKNFGDDYILDQWVDFYRKARPDLRLVYARQDSWLSGFYFDNPAVTVLPVFQEKYFRILARTQNGNAPTVPAAIAAGKMAAAELLSADSDFKGMLEATETFHLVGGGYLNRIFVDVWGIVAAFATIAERTGARLVATGLGLTPAVTDVQEADELYESFSVLESRDEEGFRQFTSRYPSRQIVNGQDDSFLSPVRQCSPAEGPTIFFCVQSNLDGDAKHESILDRCMTLIRHAGPGYRLAYLQLHDVPDLIFYRKLCTRLGLNIRTYTESELFRFGLPLTERDICITSRFHLHLLAARLGARGAYVWTGDQYYRVKHESVSALGSGWIDFLAAETSPADVLTIDYPSIRDAELVAAKHAFVSQYIL